MSWGHRGHSPRLEQRGPVTLVGEPRMGGRGFRCRKSGSFGEPRRGRQDWSPCEGCGGLACGWPNTAPSGSVGGLGSLEWTRCRSDRLGALCRRQPSPEVRGECSGTEEPGWDGTGLVTVASGCPAHTPPRSTDEAPRLFTSPSPSQAARWGPAPGPEQTAEEPRHPLPGSHTWRRREEVPTSSPPPAGPPKRERSPLPPRPRSRLWPRG